MKRLELTRLIKQKSRELGFQHVGVCPAEPSKQHDRLREWVAAGYAGEMRYIEQRIDAYQNPSHVLDSARSLVMLGMQYEPTASSNIEPGQGRVARYAMGEVDYHDLIHGRLKQLVKYIREIDESISARGVVDTAPLLEHEYAQLAGIGWSAKNTLTINPDVGSYFFLAAILVDVQLVHDQPHQVDHCGTCTACLDACPTDAFPQPYVLDATKCISYLTIELRESIPRQLREGMGDWFFGCDICQEVCPWNRKSPSTEEPQLTASVEFNPVDLQELFFLDDEGFRQRFRRTPMWRSKRRGLLRNAAIVLGNQRSRDALSALVKGLSDQEPLVRGACAWALGRFESLGRSFKRDDVTSSASISAEPSEISVLAALRDRREVETDPSVLEEIDFAVSSAV